MWCLRDLSSVLDTSTTPKLCDSCNVLLTTEQLHKHTISECGIGEHHSSHCFSERKCIIGHQVSFETLGKSYRQIF